MYEHQDIVVEASADCEVELSALESLHTLIPAMVAPQNNGFELPRSLWIGMLGFYAAFFVAIAAAAGGSVRALFAIIVSIIYTTIYFGVARIGAKQAGRERPSPLSHGKPLQTWTGPMDPFSVYGQVLIVPFAIAFFGIAVLVVTLMVS